jgi:diguanylate cyclase (GGDEF)-like protein
MADALRALSRRIGRPLWHSSLKVRVIVTIASLLIPVSMLTSAVYFSVRLVTSFGDAASAPLKELSLIIGVQTALVQVSEGFHAYARLRDSPSRAQLLRINEQGDVALRALQAVPWKIGEKQIAQDIERDWQQVEAMIAAAVRPRSGDPSSTSAEEVTHSDDLIASIHLSLDQLHRAERADIGYNLWNTQVAQQRLMRIVGFMVVGAVVTSILAATTLGRSVLRPLHSLQEAARFFGTGDLSHRVVVERRDELGRLAELFNTMAQKIERSQQALSYQASHDGLTGLVNRVLFRDRLEHALARAKRQQKSLAVIGLDLDGFKKINDSMGHSEGDALLMEVAQRLRTVIREADTAGRLGGDEFVLLLEDLHQPDDAVTVAKRTLDALHMPITVLNKPLVVRASMGIALSGDEQLTADELIRNADLALYAAKRQGRDRFELFDQSMHKAAVQQVSLEVDLRHAVENEEFTLHYQPVVELSTQAIIGVEALLRWQHPSRGLVLPAEFIPIAEETGLIVPIGRWVLREACRQARMWQADSPVPLPVRIGVNISVKQLEDPGFVVDVAQALRDSGLAPEALILEITEAILAQNLTVTGEVLMRMKQLGVRVAVDDFGVGYSSLNNLRRLPVDIVKIDKSFVASLTQPEEMALTSAIVALSKALNLQTLAEGIEHAEEAGELRALGCDAGQGYFFAKPIDAAQMGEVLRAARLRGNRLQVEVPGERAS